MVLKHALKNRGRGMSMVELLVTLGVGTTLSAIALSSWVVLNQAFANTGSYAVFAQETRAVTARVAKDVRTMETVVSTSSTNVVLQDAASNQVQIVYNPALNQLILTSNSTSTVLVRDCSSASFSLYSSSLTSGTWNAVLATSNAAAAAVQISWTSQQTNGRTRCTYQGKIPIVAFRNR